MTFALFLACALLARPVWWAALHTYMDDKGRWWWAALPLIVLALVVTTAALTLAAYLLFGHPCTKVV